MGYHILDPATDQAISDAVRAWLEIDGNPFVPPPDDMVVVFKYPDGTGGSIRRGATGLIYFYRTSLMWSELAFTPECFHDLAVDLISSLHDQAARSIELAGTA